MKTDELMYTTVEVFRSRDETKFIIHGRNYTAPRLSNDEILVEAVSLASQHAQEAKSYLKNFSAYSLTSGFRRGHYSVTVWAS